MSLLLKLKKEITKQKYKYSIYSQLIISFDFII